MGLEFLEKHRGLLSYSPDVPHTILEEDSEVYDESPGNAHHPRPSASVVSQPPSADGSETPSDHPLSGRILSRSLTAPELLKESGGQDDGSFTPTSDRFATSNSSGIRARRGSEPLFSEAGPTSAESEITRPRSSSDGVVGEGRGSLMGEGENLFAL